MAKLFTPRLRFDLSETVENDDRDLEIEARLRKLSDKQIALFPAVKKAQPGNKVRLMNCHRLFC